MSEFKVYSDCEHDWIEKDGNILFAEDCAATMNQQAETIKQLEQERDTFISEDAESQLKITQLEARVARLEKGLDYAGVKLLEHKNRRAYEYVDGILCEEPPQSLHAIKHALTDDLTIDRPAKIGHMKFGKGVPWRLVVECAQRQFEQSDKSLQENQ